MFSTEKDKERNNDFNSHDEERVTLTVYFSGTAFTIKDQSNLDGFLYKATQGVSLSNKDDITEEETAYKMGFDGCGVEYGFRGAIFGTGLDEQCKKVVEIVIELLKQGKRVNLNAYGFSRGGIACLLLAKMLSEFPKDILEINLALMDPVPGNLITTSSLDFAHFTLAKQAMDLTRCRNLNKVLAIYPIEPLEDVICNDQGWHAALIPDYPVGCQVKEEIVPGCHVGSQSMSSYEGDGHSAGSAITFNLMSRFMKEVGTHLDLEKFGWNLNDDEEMDCHLLMRYEEGLTRHRSTSSRACHASSNVSIKAKNNDHAVLTPTHEELKDKYGLEKPRLYYALRKGKQDYNSKKQKLLKKFALAVKLDEKNLQEANELYNQIKSANKSDKIKDRVEILLPRFEGLPKKSKLYEEAMKKYKKLKAAEKEWCAKENFLLVQLREAKSHQQETKSDEKKYNGSKYAYHLFSPNCAPPAKEKEEANIEERSGLLKEFLQEILTNGLSTVSRQSHKGRLLGEFSNILENLNLYDDYTFKNVLRNMLALCLQRNKNSYSLFSTTTSGLKALSLLNSEKYKIFSEVITNNTVKKACYGDLRTFVLGRNDKNYFNAKNSQLTYDIFNAVPTDGDESKSPFLLNNVGSYLSRDSRIKN